MKFFLLLLLLFYGWLTGLAIFPEDKESEFKQLKELIVIPVNKKKLSEKELTPVLVDGKYGYIDTKGEMIIDPVFERAYHFSGGYARVRANKTWYFINTQARQLFEISEELKDCVYEDFSFGLAAVKKNKKWGFINLRGKFVVRPQFRNVGSFSDGLAWVEVEGELAKFGRVGFIDTKGRMVIRPSYQEAMSFSDNMAAVQVEALDSRWGYINKKGKMIIPVQYYRAFSFYSGLARVSHEKGDGFSLINTKGKYIITRPDLISGMSDDDKKKLWYQVGDALEGLAPVGWDDSWFFINSRGRKTAISFDCTLVNSLAEGLAVFRNDKKKYGYLNQQGRVIIPAEYDRAETFKNGLADVHKDGRRYYINLKGEIVWQFK